MAAQRPLDHQQRPSLEISSIHVNDHEKNQHQLQENEFDRQQRPSLEISSIHVNDHEKNQHQLKENELDYSQRAQWLRAAVLGANDGLVSVASLMMGIGAVKKEIKPMLLAGFAGLVAGACSMAIGEFVSVYTQRDIEIAQMKRDQERAQVRGDESEEENGREALPNPTQAAMASALAFSAGAVVPLVGSAFIRDYRVRLGVVVALASMMLVVFGAAGAVLGRTPVVKSCVRVLIGGWMAMALTFGLTKLISSGGLEM